LWLEFDTPGCSCPLADEPESTPLGLYMCSADAQTGVVISPTVHGTYNNDGTYPPAVRSPSSKADSQGRKRGARHTSWIKGFETRPSQKWITKPELFQARAEFPVAAALGCFSKLANIPAAKCKTRPSGLWLRGQVGGAPQRAHRSRPWLFDLPSLVGRSNVTGAGGVIHIRPFVEVAGSIPRRPGSSNPMSRRS